MEGVIAITIAIGIPIKITKRIALPNRATCDCVKKVPTNQVDAST